MTKEQKTQQVADMVEELRKHYTYAEFAAMATAIWQALDTAAAAAIQESP